MFLDVTNVSNTPAEVVNITISVGRYSVLFLYFITDEIILRNCESGFYYLHLQIF